MVGLLIDALTIFIVWIFYKGLQDAEQRIQALEELVEEQEDDVQNYQ
jgi:hypothetical protein